jgi:hypothetical protein
VDNDRLEKYPLSLRVNGSPIVRPVNYYNFELNDISESDLVHLLKTINNKVAEIKEKFTTEESYLKYIRENKVLNEYSYLTNLLFCKKYDELLFFIDYCKQNNITSGMSFYRNGKSENYFDTIIKYINVNKPV